MSQAQPFKAHAIDRLPLIGRHVIATPLGDMTALATPNGLAGLWFDFEATYGSPCAVPLQPELPVLAAVRSWLLGYWSGQPRTTLPVVALDLHGTPFQRAVWQALARIPYGHTVSYSDIAQAVEKPAAVRAAGGAIGANPAAVLVPCHRVLGRSGALTGFSAGIERKQKLLQHEGLLLA
jgi:methylated-DNA-[protein]-cysteine S-methyltransferase